jgi:hypothetical protein
MARTKLCEMVTGLRAFHGYSKMSTLAAAPNMDPKPASEMAKGIPRELERIINGCLSLHFPIICLDMNPPPAWWCREYKPAWSEKCVADARPNSG